MRTKHLTYLNFLGHSLIAKHGLYSKIALFSHYAHGELLDVGCGTKPYLPLFEQRVKHYTGLDFSKTAGKRIDHADVVGDATKLPFRVSTFDTILSTEVIEHIPEPAKALSEMYRVLRPGGYLILSAPLFWPLHEEPHDFYRYTKFGLNYLLKSAGFSIKETGDTTGFFETVGQLFAYGLYLKYGQNSGTIIRKVIILGCIFIQTFFILLGLIFGKFGDSLSTVIVARKLKTNRL